LQVAEDAAVRDRYSGKPQKVDKKKILNFFAQLCNRLFWVKPASAQNEKKNAAGHTTCSNQSWKQELGAILLYQCFSLCVGLWA
jgi:hypothetical protein